MGMTMSQKILAAHANLPEVKAGQLIEARLDMVLGNDVTSPVAINVFNDCNATKVFDNTKIAMVMDHFTPNKDIKSAQNCLQVREFAGKYDIKNFLDVGEMGIEHALLPEKGLVGPGSLCIGADSHTCTYGALGAFSTGVGSTDMAAGMISGKAWFKVPSAIKFNLIGKPQKFVSGKDVILHIIGMIGVDGALYKSMEFAGEGLKYLNIDDRLCIANMAIEAGAKNGIFPVDDITREYTNGRFQGEPVEYTADEDAEYEAEYTVDLSQLKPTVAFPHLPENTITIGSTDKSASGTYSAEYMRSHRLGGGRLSYHQRKNRGNTVTVPHLAHIGTHAAVRHSGAFRRYMLGTCHGVGVEVHRRAFGGSPHCHLLQDFQQAEGQQNKSHCRRTYLLHMRQCGKRRQR